MKHAIHRVVSSVAGLTLATLAAGCLSSASTPEMPPVRCVDQPNAPPPSSGTEPVRLVRPCWLTPWQPGEVSTPGGPSPRDRLLWGRYFDLGSGRAR
jgi:hypothetical protein